MVCLVTAVLVLAPPAQGAMLIVSLDRESPGQIARWATAHDARLVGPGPLPHSLVVTGSRAALGKAALAHRGVLFAAVSAGCGRTG